MNRDIYRFQSIFLVLSLLFSNTAFALRGMARFAELEVKSERAAPPVPAPARLSKEQAREAFGRPGVSFEENRGQTDGRVEFLSHSGGQTVYLTRDAVRTSGMRLSCESQVEG